ncbi:MAG TPA: MBOAT family O-acyltransferase [Chthoniobacteraceae bacterium]|nr:MBOAT family O-acyltransferase [Chthoniobacteraceae bacterium]
MLFNSIQFFNFFVVVFVLYWAIPIQRLRTILLLGASYYFYMSWNAKLAAVVAGSSLIDYFLARALEASPARMRRKMYLAVSIVMNLGLLFYFKYMNFFLQSIAGLTHKDIPFLQIALPIGISFYTFEAISYMTDVYLKRTPAERDPIHFLLFITFFPRMIAGPIIRARNFLPQVKREKRFDIARFKLGLEFVIMGLYKKIAIADRMSWLVDPIYATPKDYSTAAMWVGSLAYSLQLYCDFSGYSDVAIGTAHMLGFKLPENFNMPYASRNLTEFWQRWHISLSTWLRDYVFLSLGGSRQSRLKMSINLLFTMTLCGLWHGARWTFVAFGFAEGVMILIHHQFRAFCKPRPQLRKFLRTNFGTGLRIIVTFSTSLVLPGILFRAQKFSDAAEVFKRLFVPSDGLMVRHPVGTWSLVFGMFVLIACHFIAESGLWKRIAPKLPPFTWGLGCAVALVLIFLLRTESQKAFIYFQF